MGAAEKARMKVLDLNHDGKIGKMEHQREKQMFDVNKDGKIGLMERLRQFDISTKATGDFNRDGKVDNNERTIVRAYDKNHDRKIGPLENQQQKVDWDLNGDGKVGRVERGNELRQLNFLA
jgi:hypothetical protein